MKRVVKCDANLAKSEARRRYMDVCIPYLRVTTGEDGYVTKQSLDEASDFGDSEYITDSNNLPVEQYSDVRSEVREFLSDLKLSPCATYKVDGEFRINYVETAYPQNRYIDPDTVRVVSYDFSGLTFNKVG